MEPFLAKTHKFLSRTNNRLPTWLHLKIPYSKKLIGKFQPSDFEVHIKMWVKTIIMRDKIMPVHQDVGTHYKFMKTSTTTCPLVHLCLDKDKFFNSCMGEFFYVRLLLLLSLLNAIN